MAAGMRKKDEELTAAERAAKKAAALSAASSRKATKKEVAGPRPPAARLSAKSSRPAGPKIQRPKQKPHPPTKLQRPKGIGVPKTFKDAVRAENASGGKEARAVRSLTPQAGHMGDKKQMRSLAKAHMIDPGEEQNYTKDNFNAKRWEEQSGMPAKQARAQLRRPNLNRPPMEITSGPRKGTQFSLDGNTVVGQDADGNSVPTKKLGSMSDLRQGLRRPQQQQQPQDYKAGQKYRTDDGKGMDVTFAPGTSQEERQAFMRRPVHGGTRRRSNLPGKTSRIPQQQTSTPQQTKVPELNTFGDIMRYKAQMAQQRQDAAINDKRQNRSIDAFRAVNDQQRAESQGRYYGAKTDKYRAEAGAASNAQNLFEEYRQEKDPAKKESLRKQYLTAMGKDARRGTSENSMTREDLIELERDTDEAYNTATSFMDPEERPSKEEWVRENLPRAGEDLYGGQDTGPQPDPEDIEKAMKDRKLRQQFIDYFGAPPEDFS